MKPDQDAYGQMVWDHLRGRRAHEVVERDDGFFAASANAPANYFAPFRAWPRHQRQAMRWVRGRALDVGCGAGRWALHLQARGHPVVAIDASPLAVRTSRRRGVRDARVIPFARVSPRLGSFDTVVMMGNNFGLFGGERRGRMLLRRLARMTSPGARIVAESNDPRATRDRHHRAYHRRNRARGRLPGQLRIRVRYAIYCTPWFDYLMVSPAEMRRLVRGTGWRVARVVPSAGSLYAALIEKESRR